MAHHSEMSPTVKGGAPIHRCRAVFVALNLQKSLSAYVGAWSRSRKEGGPGKHRLSLHDRAKIGWLRWAGEGGWIGGCQKYVMQSVGFSRGLNVRTSHASLGGVFRRCWSASVR